jgi:hypothetical protein
MQVNDKQLHPSIVKAQKAKNFSDSKNFLTKVFKSVKLEGKPKEAP